MAELGVPVVVCAVLKPPMLSSFLKLMRCEKLNVRDLVALEGAERCQDQRGNFFGACFRYSILLLPTIQSGTSG